MTCPTESFKIRFPEFGDVPDLRIEMFFDDAVGFIGANKSRWFGNYDKALCYLTAHLLVVAGMQADGDFNPVAPISKQGVDDVIIEQAVSAVSVTDDECYSTSYGRRYLRYRKISFGGMMLGV